jgi:DNA ligase-1
MQTFPILFAKNSGGGLKSWEVRVEPNNVDRLFFDVVTTYGKVGGKMQEARETILGGKNIGKANETSLKQQALNEAQSKWELQKKKKGYVESQEAALAGEVDVLVQGGIFPMLAQKFKDRADKIEYPVFIQPKFDGHRCIAVVKKGVCTLWSRTRKPILSVPHVCRAVERLTGGADAVLDGELYNHEYKHNFEQITKLITPKAPVEGHEKVQYYIYDMPSEEVNFKERNFRLNNVFSLRASEVEDVLINVPTMKVDSEDEVQVAFDTVLSDGYEGLMLRTADAPYKSHPTSRSSGLLKMKKFDDAEFEIVDVTEGSGKFKGLAMFVCRAGNGETFKAVKNAPLEELRTYFKQKELLIGRVVTVQFMGFTNANHVPRHGRVVRFREDL